MDPKEITKLAQLLRENGDKVLAGDFKLCLSGAILRALNDSFTLIAESADLTSPQSFQVVKPNNSKSEVFRDLQLIHDFVQKTVLLCISKFFEDDDFEGNIDISKFRSLRRLEVHKVKIKQIVGIQPLRAQLQHLICNRSIESVADIITYCGGDDSNGFVWNELKTANFSYNNLKTVDASLEFAQWLQHLTLSYNQLSSVAAIKWLPHLKVLDLRYNRLTTIPSFHTEASRRLQVLIISNNLIEDLGGISRLEALNELDLSNNCLLDHMSLLPLSTLISLRYLNLQGNPLACHPKHRRAATTYLHKNTASVKFVLDTEPLSKTEKTNVGRYPNYQSVLTMRLTGDTRSSGQSTPTRKSQAVTPTSSIGSEKSFKLNKSEAEMTVSTIEKQKKIKVRSVQIEEHKTEQETYNNTADRTDLDKSFHMETSTDHLETKKQIEDLRNKYGEGWLKSKNAHVVQSVLGLDTLGSSDEQISQKTLINDFLNDIEIPQPDNIESSTYTEATMLTSTPINTKDNETFNFSSDIIITDKQEESSEPSVYKTAPAITDEIYSSDCHQSEFDSVSDPEDNEMTYIVTERASSDQYFLTISDTYIKEKDSLTRRTKTKWSLKILESCDRIKSNTLRINFDTIKKDKKERIYIVEEGLCQDLENILRGVLSKRQLSEMNQIVYRCINCSCQFSRERIFQRRNPVIFCPECKKSFVVEVNESPKTSVSPPKILSSTNNQNTINPPNQDLTVDPAEIQIADRQEPEKSASHSSIANDKGTWRLSAHKNISSAGSLNESSSCSKISNSESSFDSNQSIAGSSTNDRDQDFNFSKNYESDVEVLSNPSQSSIEVLDHGHPSRKTSEERKISRIPSLETIQDQSVQNTPRPLISRETSTETSQNELPIKDVVVEGINKKVSLGPINLTESSSSGSVTDSICTAYEQGDKDTPVTSDAPKKITQPEKDNKKEESIISSMFGGLFQSTNLLMSRSQKPVGADSPSACETFKFNYKDFSDVDHRLKLFFYQTKFEDDKEHFKWLVKGKIFNENTYQLYEGILVMSTTKLYVMEIFGPENDEMQKWLKQIFSGTINRIEGVQLLPWKIGMSFKIRGWDQFSLILQDISRTDSLLLFFANNPLPDECTFDYQPSERVRTKLTSFVKEVQLNMFSILNKCEVSSENTEQIFSTTAFFTTDTHLYLTSTNLSWLSDNSDAEVESGLVQLMSNIVDVVTPARNVFTINFLDEIQNKYELWRCTFETDENADSCLNAIGQSWEKLFGVPFFVSN